MYCIINASSITQFLSMILVFIHKYPMYMYSNTLYTVTMTHIICGINLSCCSLNQVLYSGCVTITSSPHQSSPSSLHMRRVDQNNTCTSLLLSRAYREKRACNAQIFKFLLLLKIVCRPRRCDITLSPLNVNCVKRCTRDRPGC